MIVYFFNLVPKKADYFTWNSGGTKLAISCKNVLYISNLMKILDNKKICEIKHCKTHLIIKNYINLFRNSMLVVDQQ